MPRDHSDIQPSETPSPLSRTVFQQPDIGQAPGRWPNQFILGLTGLLDSAILRNSF